MIYKIFFAGLITCLSVISACDDHLIHHTVKSEILLKDRVYLCINVDFCSDNQESYREIKAKSAQLSFAMTLALREHASSELQGRGKRSVHNALKSIARQVVDHPVTSIHITTYDFLEKP